MSRRAPRRYSLLGRLVSNYVARLSHRSGWLHCPAPGPLDARTPNAMILVVPWPTGLLAIVVLLLAAAPFAELTVNSGLVPATRVLLEARIGWGLPRLKVDDAKAAG